MCLFLQEQCVQSKEVAPELVRSYFVSVDPGQVDKNKQTTEQQIHYIKQHNSRKVSHCEMLNKI